MEKEIENTNCIISIKELSSELKPSHRKNPGINDFAGGFYQIFLGEIIQRFSTFPVFFFSPNKVPEH